MASANPVVWQRVVPSPPQAASAICQVAVVSPLALGSALTQSLLLPEDFLLSFIHKLSGHLHPGVPPHHHSSAPFLYPVRSPGSRSLLMAPEKATLEWRTGPALLTGKPMLRSPTKPQGVTPFMIPCILLPPILLPFPAHEPLPPQALGFRGCREKLGLKH